ncbi:MAG: T9SS type A sorting domain-containing protein [Bacteroidia bacterium]
MQYKYLFTVLLTLTITVAQGQQKRQRFLPVSQPWYLVDSDTSALGFSGGFHAPQFIQIDLDGDLQHELVAKDAFTDREWVFKSKLENGSRKWQTATELEDVLPPLNSFFTSVDINNDGLIDIITGNDQFKVYLNQSHSTVEFSSQPTALKYEFENELYAITFQVGETPCIADVNADNKPDVLVFDQNGERVIFYKNISQTANEFVFEIETESWGFFQEEGLNFDIKLGVNKKAHPGSKILAFDSNADGDMDLLISDITTADAFFLENGKADFGLAHDSMISLTKNYPSQASAINVPYFPSFSLIDFDFDNDLDLVCANSSRSPVDNGLVWLYENGNADGFDLSLKTKSFLQEKSIDLGIYTANATFDFDNDGDLDLLVSGINHLKNDIFQEQYAYLAYYQNVGTATAPLFTLQNHDFLNYKAQEQRLLLPSFGDIDNDGDKDLLLGLSNGQVVVRLNIAAKGMPFEFSNDEIKIEGVDVGTEAAPILFDVNTDGISDLIIGEQGGNLNYYMGKGNLLFELKNNNWGGVKTNTFYWQPVRNNDGEIIDSTKQYLSVGGSHPTIADVDANGLPDLLVGSTWGKMYYYPDVDFSDSYFRPSAVWYHNPLLNQNFDKDLGSNTKPHFADLNQDGYLELLVGTFCGGVELFTADSVVVSNPDKFLNASNVLDVYPNPFESKIWVATNTFSLNAPISVNIYSAHGKKIGNLYQGLNNADQLYLKPDLLGKSGIYFIELVSDKHRKIVKVIKR